MSDPSKHSESTPATPAREGLLVVVSGPSGVGKTTIVRALVQSLDARFSVSATTRGPRSGEVEGKDYFFVTPGRFQQMLKDGEFLEHAQVFGRDWYGTPAGPIREQIAAGLIVLLDIDVQGALQVRDAMPEALLIFIKPPAEDTLLARLHGRADVDEQQIHRRLAEAKHEIATAQSSGAYDHFIVNDDLEKAVTETRAYVRARKEQQRN